MNEFSTAAWSVWGKTNPATGGHLPLLVHMQDSIHVAEWLWDRWLPESVKRLIADAVGSHDDAKVLVAWLAGIHDTGKCSRDFAVQAALVAPSLLDRMRDAGLAVGQRVTKIGHATVGQIVLQDWLVERGFAPRSAGTFATVVGGHHGRNPTDCELRDARLHPENFGDGEWVRVRDELLTAMASISGAGQCLQRWKNLRLPRPVQVLLTGIVIVADWLASNEELFPYGESETSAWRAERAMADLALMPPWRPGAVSAIDEQFQSRFPSLAGLPPHPIQVAMVDAANRDRPPLLILEAQPGGGKTEAALLAAEVLAAKFGSGGIYIGMPTMATANPMFERVLPWLDVVANEAAASLNLAHGKAGLNDSYAGLIRKSWAGQVYDEDHPEGARVVVHSFTRGRKKATLATHVVGTIDQSLFLGLQAKHVVLRHLGIAGKVVIIDEVHAADEYMRVYLRRVLTWLGAYGTPVILMSATLPPEQRDEYLRAYAEGRGDRRPHSTARTDEYPRLTGYDGDMFDVPVPADTVQRQVWLDRLDDDLGALVETLTDVLEEGGCAGVICNTVSRAQEAYAELRGRFGDDVVLVHSRFLAPHRVRIEQGIVSHLGKGGDRPQRLIVVGTQVLEQSLDIDFDVLVTDLAPIDLVLQRIGRLHRHDRQRPRLLTAPRCLVRGVDWAQNPPEPIRGSKFVYGAWALLRALAVLQTAWAQGIELPRDVPGLVRRGYDPELPAPADWDRPWSEAKSADGQKRARAVHHASGYLIGVPRQAPTLDGWLPALAPDPESAESRGKQQVRDTDESLEVIAVWRGEDGLRLPEGVGPKSGRLIPTQDIESDIGRTMAGCTLSLPPQMTADPATLDRVIGALEAQPHQVGWQSSPWIAGQLSVVFDDDDRAQVAGFELRYDFKEGLIVTTVEEEA